jgi:hypothetical protein
VDVQKLGYRVALANGYIRRDNERIVRASAVLTLPAANSAGQTTQASRMNNPND